jgi:hypothetical protein
MRKVAIAAALASTAIAAPAFARDDAWYLGADAGAIIVENLKLNSATAGAGQLIHHRKPPHGFDVDGVIGYDFGAFRLEAETAYKRVGNKRTFWGPAPGFTTAPGFAGVKGRTDALSFMVNGLVDLGPDDGRKRHVGGELPLRKTQRQHQVFRRHITDDRLDGASAVGLWGHGCCCGPEPVCAG